MTIIIFEGTDKSGKSTMCERFSKSMRLPIFKYWGTLPKEWSLEYEKEFRTEILSRLSKNGIWDRSHISEMVYSSNRGLDKESNLWYLALDKLIGQSKSILFFMKRDPNELKNDLDHTDPNIAKIKKDLKAFERVIAKSSINNYVIQGTLNECEKQIKDILEEEFI